MDFSDIFFKAVGIDRNDKLSTQKFSRKIGIPVDRLKNYNNTNTLPTGKDLELICDALHITPEWLMLKMGAMNHRMISAIRQRADQIYPLIKHVIENIHKQLGCACMR